MRAFEAKRKADDSNPRAIAWWREHLSETDAPLELRFPDVQPPDSPLFGKAPRMCLLERNSHWSGPRHRLK